MTFQEILAAAVANLGDDLRAVVVFALVIGASIFALQQGWSIIKWFISSEVGPYDNDPEFRDSWDRDHPDEW